VGAIHAEREAVERNLMQLRSRLDLADRSVLAWREDPRISQSNSGGAVAISY
jgi:hypothetical protein